jgi:hypothetical protein
MAHITGHINLWQRLKLKSYRYKLLQYVIAQGKEVGYKLYCDSLSGFAGETFTSKIVFSDKSILHLSRNINHHNLRIWGSKKTEEVNDHTRDSPKLNEFFVLSKFNVRAFFLCRNYCDWYSAPRRAEGISYAYFASRWFQ